jgi:hypothetical protein
VGERTVGVKYSTIKYPCGCISEMDKMIYCGIHDGKEVIGKLKSAEITLRAIYGMINDQVDEKIRGERKGYSWGKVISQINEESFSMAEEIKHFLEKESSPREGGAK